MLGRTPIDTAPPRITSIHFVSFMSIPLVSGITLNQRRKANPSGIRLVGVICSKCDFCGEPKVLNGGLKPHNHTCKLEYALC
jgi:hypothetical protein